MVKKSELKSKMAYRIIEVLTLMAYLMLSVYVVIIFSAGEGSEIIWLLIPAYLVIFLLNKGFVYIFFGEIEKDI